MSYRFKPLFCLAVCAIFSMLSGRADALIRCEMNGKSVNPNNGSETAKLTGILRCKDEDSGKLQREQELRDGKYLGVERFFDREGRLERERNVNERGNSQGVEKSFWPNGKLKSEGTSDNGTTQGLVRHYFDSGRPSRLAFYRDRRALLDIGFNPDGSYGELRCPDVSLIAEDRKACGFDGKTETTLQNSKGVRIAQHVWEQGKLLSLTLYRNGDSIESTMFFEQGRRVRRVYGEGKITPTNASGANVLREERIYEPPPANELALNASAGRLQSSRLWGSNGQLIEQQVYVDGKVSQADFWYLNGAKKEKTVATGSGSSLRTLRELFSDDGKLVSRHTLGPSGAASGLQQYYFANGKLQREELFGEPGSAGTGRSRVLSHKEWDDTGKLVADDEVLEDGSRRRK